MLDENYSTALKCVDYMIETAKYPNFSERNSWSMEMKNTLVSMLRDVLDKNSSEYIEPYSEKITLSIIQVAEKCLPYLDRNDAKEVKSVLVNLKPTEENKHEFICQLMVDVDEYVAARKYRDIDTGEIIQGIETLSRFNRVDLIAQILLKITEGRNNIEGPSYESWITGFTRVTDEQLLELYSMIPNVYSTYIEYSDLSMALRLLQRFGNLGDTKVYKAIRNQVLQKHGYIDGMGSCFHFSDKSTTPIVLCDNKVFQVSFLFWNVFLFNTQSYIHGAEISFKVKNKSRSDIDLVASDILINGIPLSELQQDENDMNNQVNICRYLDGGEERIERLSMYWWNQSEHCFKEISHISLSILAQRDNKDIAKSGPFIISRDLQNEAFELKNEVTE